MLALARLGVGSRSRQQFALFRFGDGPRVLRSTFGGWVDQHRARFAKTFHHQSERGMRGVEAGQRGDLGKFWPHGHLVVARQLFLQNVKSDLESGVADGTI